MQWILDESWVLKKVFSSTFLAKESTVALFMQRYNDAKKKSQAFHPLIWVQSCMHLVGAIGVISTEDYRTLHKESLHQKMSLCWSLPAKKQKISGSVAKVASFCYYLSNFLLIPFGWLFLIFACFRNAARWLRPWSKQSLYYLLT